MIASAFLVAPETIRGLALLLYARCLILYIVLDKIQRIGVVAVDLDGDMDMVISVRFHRYGTYGGDHIALLYPVALTDLYSAQSAVNAHCVIDRDLNDFAEQLVLAYLSHLAACHSTDIISEICGKIGARVRLPDVDRLVVYAVLGKLADHLAVFYRCDKA